MLTHFTIYAVNVKRQISKTKIKVVYVYVSVVCTWSVP